MAASKILIAGFGGQGIMLMGELLAQAAMLEGKEVTWIPYYGPEMRGGTANGTAVISDKPVASPIVTTWDIVIAMNEPSLLKFESQIAKGGMLFINCSLIKSAPKRGDLMVHNVACNQIASEIHSDKIANMVMLGAFLSIAGVVSPDSVKAAMEEKFKGAKSKLIPVNKQALHAFMNATE